MNEQYIFITNNDNVSLTTMNAFKSSCTQLLVNPTRIVWHWLSLTTIDSSNAVNLCNNVGQSGYPIASLRYQA
jgi:hypothetical protein